MRKSPTPPRTPFTPRSFTSLPALKNAPDGEILSDSDLPFLSKSNIPPVRKSATPPTPLFMPPTAF